MARDGFSLAITGLDAARELLSPQQYQRAIQRTLARTTSHVRAALVREVRSEYAVGAAAVRAAIAINHASSADRAVISVTSTRLPLVLFAPRQVRVPVMVQTHRRGGRPVRGYAARRYGASIRIKQAGGRKRVRGAFLATMPSGHLGVFSRRGAARLKIDELRTLAVPQMVSNPRVLDRIRDDALVFMQRTFAAEVRFRSRA